VVALFIPVATGGGPASRLAFAGGAALTRAAAHVPAEIRALQAGIKLAQAWERGEQLPLPGFEAPGAGVVAEQYVSEQINAPRNVGRNRVQLSADYFTSKTKVRIPDFDPRFTPGKIVEVKDRGAVYLVDNVADFVEYARRNSLQLELWIRRDAYVDSALLKLTQGDNPLVVLRYLDGK